MIRMPLTDIVARIKEAGLSQEEIDKRIKQKMDQLSGLISKEGAAHIIANELGIKLIEKASGRLQIKNILTGMRNVEVVGKAVAVYEVRTFQTGEREGKVGSFVLGDETGTIRCACWGSLADNIDKMSQGDVIKVTGAYIKDNQGRTELHLNDRSSLEINPPGETVKDVQTKPQTSRKRIKELQENDNNVEVLGTVVQVFDLRFWEADPETGKKIKEPVEGQKVDYGYVMNVILDDGTDNMRVAFFRNQVDKLLGKTHDEVLVYREMPEAYEASKHELLGQIIKVTGRVNKNEMFDRLELVANDVDTNPNPEEELKKLEAETTDESKLNADDIEKALKE